jgi:hypothetical protein
MSLHKKKEKLPFAIEVIGFGDEEGVRFGTTLLGSRAIAGRSILKFSMPRIPAELRSRRLCSNSA